MQRLTCLDGLRGLLALYVLLSHTVPFAAAADWVVRPFTHGGAAVDVFFILSGLVIVQSLSSYGYCARPFLIARVARIFPVFLVVFVFALAVQPLQTGFGRMPWLGQDSPARFIWSGGWPHGWLLSILAHLTMTHGLFPDGMLPNAWVEFLGAAWSLSTEWQFYLLVVLCGRMELPRLARLLLALSIVGTAWQALGPEVWQFSRAFLPNKAQYFALGVASAILLRREPGALVCYAGVLASTLLLCGVQGGADKLLPPLGWTLCLAAKLRPGWALRGTARVLSSRSAVWLGAVSYCVYLVNEPVQKLLGVGLALAVQGDGALFTALWLPGAVGLPLLAAWGLHVWIEAPVLRWGRAVARAASAVRTSSTAGSAPRAALSPRSVLVATRRDARPQAAAQRTDPGSP
jgi:peptidoglycan/LPS O-acetylase OafA/YrhL